MNFDLKLIPYKKKRRKMDHGLKCKLNTEFPGNKIRTKLQCL